jgi:hypothetical protein
MGILQFISKVCVQTAVYWGSPTENGFGQKVYADPVEVLVRWTDKTQLIKGSDGKQITCTSEVLVQQDMDLQGLLYLGSLTDFTPLELSNPVNLSGVLEIKGFDKIPLLKSTTLFVRNVYLGK